MRVFISNLRHLVLPRGTQTNGNFPFRVQIRTVSGVTPKNLAASEGDNKWSVINII